MTVILHGTWIPSKYIKSRTQDEGFFFIWAEKSFTSSAATQKGRRHPFSASAKEIIKHLPPIGIEDLFETEVLFLLPSLNGQVLPSSSLLIKEDIDNEESSTSDQLNGEDDELLLLPWRIKGLGLKGEKVWNLLLHLDIDNSTPSALLLGEDIKFWITTSKFSLELLVKGEIVPTIWSKNPRESKDFRAGWRLHPEGARIS